MSVLACAPKVRRQLRNVIKASRLSGALTLWDGAHLHIRPIRPDDDARLGAFHAGLSVSSIVFRFFTYLPTLTPEKLQRLTHVDYRDRMAVIATTDVSSAEQIVAVARYDRIGETAAEVAFAVADAWQQRGVGTALLLLLADYARAQGYTTFIACVMAENTRMLYLLGNSGFPLTTASPTGEIDVALDITAPPTGSLAPIAFTPDE